MAIDKLTINDLLIDIILGAPPPPDDTPKEEPIDPQPSDLPCTPDLTKTKVDKYIVGLENAGEKGYGKATGLYNKHWNYSEQWHPWHPFRSAHDFQQAALFPANKTIDRLKLKVCTGQLQNWIIAISKCPAKASLWTQFLAWGWLLDSRWLTYVRNIILQW